MEGQAPRPAREQAVEHAEAAGHPLCVVCGRRSVTVEEGQTCGPCLSEVRANLAGVFALWVDLHRMVGGPRGVAGNGGRGGGDEHALPGGTVLALLAPGSSGGAPRRLTPTDIARGLDGREHQVDNHPDDTPSAGWTLVTWEDDWRHTRREPAAEHAAHTDEAVKAAHGYLERHTLWASGGVPGQAGHPAFDEYADELRALHVRMQQAAQQLRNPTKAGADCFDCGGDLVRLVDPDTGLEDEHVTCSYCEQVYNPGRYRWALKAAAEAASRIEVDGERWATPAALARDLDRSERTVRSWHQRGQIRSLTRGRILFVNVADGEARHAENPPRAVRGA